MSINPSIGRGVSALFRTSLVSHRDGEIAVFGSASVPTTGVLPDGQELASTQRALCLYSGASATDEAIYFTADGGTTWDKLLELSDLLLPAVSDITAASGVVTLTGAAHTIRGEGASADNVDTISGMTATEIAVLVTGAEAITYRDASVGSGNIATSGNGSIVTATGDMVLAILSGSLVTVAPLAVAGGHPADLNDVAAGAVDVSADSLLILDADDDGLKKESFADLATAMAGTGLTAASGALSLATSHLVTATTAISGGDGSGNVGDLNSTPVTIIAAQGANTIVIPESFVVEFVGGAAAYDNAGAGNDLVFQYGGGGAEITPDIDNGNGGSTRFLRSSAGSDYAVVVVGENAEFIPSVNQPIELTVRTADPYSAAGDVAINVYSTYRVVDVS